MRNSIVRPTRLGQRRGRRIVATMAALGMVLAGPFPAAQAHDDGGPVFVDTLAADESVFWEGGHVGSSVTHSLPFIPSLAPVDRCAILDPCFEFALTTTDPGARLRIAFDTPMRDNNFEMHIEGPTGRTFRQANANAYSMEQFINAPEMGTWTIKVAPYSAEHASFRMRAKLESEPHTPQPNDDGLLLPNLQVTRMFEFGFAAPANPANGLWPPDDANPPLEAFGYRPLSCAADEKVEEGAERCLRYSFALANLGPGNFDIRWSGERMPDPDNPVSTTGQQHEMTQCVQHADGTVSARPAGTGSFHFTHGHWHYDDIIYHDLLRVTDLDAGELEPAGEGKKIGYSPADQGIAEWDRFVQRPRGTSGSAGNCAPGTNQRLGMSVGWGDAYRYQRPGNYVEFGVNGDGHYIVRTIVDPLGQVLEADDTNNTTYAHIYVEVERVRVLEVGLGEHPWDPDKQIIE